MLVKIRRDFPSRLSAAAIAGTLVFLVAPEPGLPFDNEKMEKDISIMENVINTDLVESDLVYVYDTENNVRGLYVPGFGAVFTFDARLTSEWAAPYFTIWHGWGKGRGGSSFWWFSPEDRRKLEKLLKKLDITINGEKVDIEAYLEGDEDEEEERDGNGKAERRKELVEKNLEEFEEELAGLIADYGGTIRQLRDDEWIMIVAYLGSSHRASSVRKLSVRVRKRDVDLYDRGEIDYEELRSRMIVERL